MEMKKEGCRSRVGRCRNGNRIVWLVVDVVVVVDVGELCSSGGSSGRGCRRRGCRVVTVGVVLDVVVVVDVLSGGVVYGVIVVVVDVGERCCSSGFGCRDCNRCGWCCRRNCSSGGGNGGCGGVLVPPHAHSKVEDTQANLRIETLRSRAEIANPVAQSPRD